VADGLRGVSVMECRLMGEALELLTGDSNDLDIILAICGLRILRYGRKNFLLMSCLLGIADISPNFTCLPRLLKRGLLIQRFFVMLLNQPSS
jgi:hypothetical protein